METPQGKTQRDDRQFLLGEKSLLRLLERNHLKIVPSMLLGPTAMSQAPHDQRHQKLRKSSFPSWYRSPPSSHIIPIFYFFPCSCLYEDRGLECGFRDRIANTKDMISLLGIPFILHNLYHLLLSHFVSIPIIILNFFIVQPMYLIMYS